MMCELLFHGASDKIETGTAGPAKAGSAFFKKRTCVVTAPANG